MTQTQITDIGQYRQQKRRAGNFRWILMILFAFACMCAGYFFALSSFFAVTEIDIRGNEQVSAQRLQSLAGIEPGDNILLFSPAEIELFLRIHPYVAEASVRRILPGTVIIEVIERQAVARLVSGQAHLKIDADGFVLERRVALEPEWVLGFPLLTGVGHFPRGILPGSYIESENIAVALQVLNSLPPSALQDITEIDVSDPQKIRLHLPGSVELRLGGPTDLVAKFVLAVNIADYLYQTGQAAGIQYVDVSSDRPVIMPR
jgi:cell division protein FtsQ